MYAQNLLCFLLLNLKMPKTNWGNKRVNIGNLKMMLLTGKQIILKSQTWLQ